MHIIRTCYVSTFWQSCVNLYPHTSEKDNCQVIFFLLSITCSFHCVSLFCIILSSVLSQTAQDLVALTLTSLLVDQARESENHCNADSGKNVCGFEPSGSQREPMCCFCCLGAIGHLGHLLPELTETAPLSKAQLSLKYFGGFTWKLRCFLISPVMHVGQLHHSDLRSQFILSLQWEDFTYEKVGE